jgi:SAF domain
MPSSAMPSSRRARTTSPVPGPLRVTASRQARRPTLVALALVLILAGGMVGALVYLRATEDTQVLAVARPVAVGHAISDADLVALSLSVDPRIRPLPASARSQVVGQVATVNLVPGTLLLRRMITSRSLLQAGEGLVGLALKAGQVPEQLAPGDLVQVVRTPAAPGSGNGTAVDDGANGVPAGRARVLSVTSLADGETTRVSLIVPVDDAPALYRANATGQLALVVVAAP